jgi:hypothetical protein
MPGWTTKLCSTILLLSLLAIIGMIQVLPQVDLPDTAFHEDSSPVVTKFRSISAPVMPVRVASIHLDFFRPASEYLWHHLGEARASTANFVPILLCSLLC